MDGITPIIDYLQGEREAKYALKKELDQRINNKSVYNLSNLAFSIRGVYISSIILSIIFMHVCLVEGSNIGKIISDCY